MDVAYDHIQEEALAPESENQPATAQQPASLPTEFQEAFKAVSSSPWGATLGGWFSQARKQGENFYNEVSKEASEASTQATKGLTSLREQVVSRTRGLTLTGEQGPLSEVPGEEGVPKIVRTDDTTTGAEKGEERPENLSTDIVKEAGSLVASLRLTAAAKLKDLQRAEDAADEALLKFGTNVRNFLRDAVTISAPDEDDEGRPRGRDGAGNEVLFETQEPGTGKKVFHSTRLDAQLHAIHTSSSSFTEDPQGEEWTSWTKEFNAENKTAEIAADLKRFEELRRAMEGLVPEKVEYGAFWMRYYFLRKAIEEEERRRKEVLKGATADTEEEVAWDDDDEDEQSSTPQPQPHAKASASTTTLNASTTDNDLLKPKESRKSEDENKSVADSDASYDMVSGATSRALGSPKEKKKDDEDSDDDWE